MIKERDAARVDKKATQAYVIELSSNVYAAIREAKEAAERLRDIQRKQAEKNKEKDREAIRQRAEVVDLVFQHVAEVEALSKREVEDKPNTTRGALFSGAKPSGGAGGGGGGGGPKKRIPGGAGGGGGAAAAAAAGGGGGGGGIGLSDPTQSELPDIDIDAGLAQIQRNDQAMDEDIALIAKGVSGLENAAQVMGQELDKQGAMIQHLEDKVDKHTDHLNQLNAKLKDTLNKVGGAEKCTINIILIVIVLGLGSFLYTQFAA